MKEDFQVTGRIWKKKCMYIATVFCTITMSPNSKINFSTF